MEITSRLNTTDGIRYTVNTGSEEIHVFAESDEEALNRAKDIVEARNINNVRNDEDIVHG